MSFIHYIVACTHTWSASGSTSLGSRGLGFALTSRDVAANDGERLIYIKSVTPGGVAFEDGRLKIGDRLLKVSW